MYPYLCIYKYKVENKSNNNGSGSDSVSGRASAAAEAPCEEQEPKATIPKTKTMITKKIKIKNKIQSLHRCLWEVGRGRGTESERLANDRVNKGAVSNERKTTTSCVLVFMAHKKQII